MRLLIAIILGVAAGLGARYFLGSAALSAALETPPTMSEVTKGAVDAAAAKVAPVRAAEVALPGNPVFVEELYATGYVIRAGRINIAMSDGTTITERDASLDLGEGKGFAKLEKVERNFVRVGGRVFALKARKPQQAAVGGPSGDTPANRGARQTDPTPEQGSGGAALAGQSETGRDIPALPTSAAPSESRTDPRMLHTRPLPSNPGAKTPGKVLSQNPRAVSGRPRSSP